MIAIASIYAVCDQVAILWFGRIVVQYNPMRNSRALGASHGQYIRCNTPRPTHRRRHDHRSCCRAARGADASWCRCAARKSYRCVEPIFTRHPNLICRTTNTPSLANGSLSDRALAAVLPIIYRCARARVALHSFPRNRSLGIRLMPRVLRWHLAFVAHTPARRIVVVGIWPCRKERECGDRICPIGPVPFVRARLRSGFD